MTLNLTAENTVRFIELYQHERLLYDTTHNDYRNRRLRATATERIAAKLGVPGFGPQEVVFKFKNLRNSYSQELRKIEESGYQYFPRVHWFPLMNSFLRPFIYTRPAPLASNLAVKPVKGEQLTGNVKWKPLLRVDTDEESRSSAQEENGREKKGLDAESGFLPTLSGDVNDHLQVDLDEVMPENSLRKRLASSPEHYPRYKKYFCSTETYDGYTPLSLDQLDNSDSGFSVRKEDIYDNFGRYISSLLRELGPMESLLLQQEITTLVLGRIRETRIKQEHQD